MDNNLPVELCYAMQKHPITKAVNILLWLLIPLILWDYSDIETLGVTPLLLEYLKYIALSATLVPLLALLETFREMRSCGVSSLTCRYALIMLHIIGHWVYVKTI